MFSFVKANATFQVQPASKGMVDDDKTEKAKEEDNIISVSRASVIKHTCEMKILDSNQNNECCTKIDHAIGKSKGVNYVY